MCAYFLAETGVLLADFEEYEIVGFFFGFSLFPPVKASPSKPETSSLQGVQTPGGTLHKFASDIPTKRSSKRANLYILLLFYLENNAGRTRDRPFNVSRRRLKTPLNPSFHKLTSRRAQLLLLPYLPYPATHIPTRSPNKEVSPFQETISRQYLICKADIQATPHNYF